MTTQIHTTLPLTLDVMRQLIMTPNTSAVVSYKDSPLKGRTALIYLTNANMPSVTFDTTGVEREDVYDLIDAYITQKSTIQIQCLLDSVSQLLYEAKGVQVNQHDQLSIDQSSLVTRGELSSYLSSEARKLNFARLVHVLDNITTFALVCNDGFKATLEGREHPFPVVNDIDYVGLTFVNLLNVESFVEYYYSTDPITPPAYFSQQFDQYLYNGRNLFSYVSNTMIIATLDAFLSNRLTVDRLKDAYEEAVINS